VTYRVRFEAYALVQLHGLPTEAFEAALPFLKRLRTFLEERG